MARDDRKVARAEKKSIKEIERDVRQAKRPGRKRRDLRGLEVAATAGQEIEPSERPPMLQRAHKTVYPKAADKGAAIAGEMSNDEAISRLKKEAAPVSVGSAEWIKQADAERRDKSRRELKAAIAGASSTAKQ